MLPSLPSSSRLGTPYLSSWSSVSGVYLFSRSSRVIVLRGSGGRSMVIKIFWKDLYVRGGFPPFLSIILEKRYIPIFTTQIIYYSKVTMITEYYFITLYLYDEEMEMAIGWKRKKEKKKVYLWPSCSCLNSLFRLVECVGRLHYDVNAHLSCNSHYVGVTDFAKGLWVFLEGQACCTPLLGK